MLHTLSRTRAWPVIATVIISLAFTANCSRGLNPSQVLDDSVETVTLEADTGIILQIPKDFAATEKFLKSVSEKVSPVMRDQRIITKISEFSSELESTQGVVPMVTSLKLVEPRATCPAQSSCTSIVFQLTGFSVVNPDRPSLGSFLVEAVANSQSNDIVKVDTMRHPKNVRTLSQTIKYGVPVSLNVVDLNLASQAELLDRVLAAQGLQEAIEAFKQQEKLGQGQSIAVQSLLLPTPGSTCRQAANPCQEAFFHLVKVDGSGLKAGEFANLRVVKFLNANTTSRDQVKLLPISKAVEQD